MPYHGVRPCKRCENRKFEIVRDCGATGIIKCTICHKEKRVKWSYFVRRSRFELS